MSATDPPPATEPSDDGPAPAPEEGPAKRSPWLWATLGPAVVAIALGIWALNKRSNATDAKADLAAERTQTTPPATSTEGTKQEQTGTATTPAASETQTTEDDRRGVGVAAVAAAATAFAAARKALNQSEEEGDELEADVDKANAEAAQAQEDADEAKQQADSATKSAILSRAVEDSGMVTSVLVPWNTCGAYISGVLGVSTGAYLPYCFFNLLSPILDVIYGFIGFKVPRADEPWGDDATAMPTVLEPGESHGPADRTGT